MISRMAKPEEVLVVENDQGEVRTKFENKEFSWKHYFGEQNRIFFFVKENLMSEDAIF